MEELVAFYEERIHRQNRQAEETKGQTLKGETEDDSWKTLTDNKQFFVKTL